VLFDYHRDHDNDHQFCLIIPGCCSNLSYLQSSSRAEPRISELKGGGRLLDADCIFAYQVRHPSLSLTWQLESDLSRFVFFQAVVM
jgi:hypothetical protein